MDKAWCWHMVVYILVFNKIFKSTHKLCIMSLMEFSSNGWLVKDWDPRAWIFISVTKPEYLSQEVPILQLCKLRRIQIHWLVSSCIGSCHDQSWPELPSCTGEDLWGTVWCGMYKFSFGAPIALPTWVMCFRQCPFLKSKKPTLHNVTLYNNNGMGSKS